MVYNLISKGDVDIIIILDVLKMGWGVVINDLLIGGFWIVEEVREYINYLEMLVVLFVFKLFSILISNKYVKVMVDNIIIEVMLNNMGICYFFKFNIFIKVIWEWCISYNMWFIMVCILG